MADFVVILPLSIVMIAGPQIISAVFLATSENWQRNSLAYLAGAACSITLAVTAAYLVVKYLKDSPDSESSGGEGRVLDIVILLLLLVAAVKVYRGRKTAEAPRWMGRLQEANVGFSFKLGALLLGIFPTDIVTSVAVGTRLARGGAPWVQTLPFVGLTLLLLALPALAVVVLGARAHELLPKVRAWMNDNSWIVSEFVIGLFVVLQVQSLLSS